MFVLFFSRRRSCTMTVWWRWIFGLHQADEWWIVGQSRAFGAFIFPRYSLVIQDNYETWGFIVTFPFNIVFFQSHVVLNIVPSQWGAGHGATNWVSQASNRQYTSTGLLGMVITHRGRPINQLTRMGGGVLFIAKVWLSSSFQVN